MPLDPGQLGPPAVHVLVGLIGQKLGTLAGAGPEAAAVAAHLMSLLGLGEGLPPLPLAELTKGPAAFQAWLNALVAEPARMKAWLQHLAGLFGAGAVTASGSGTMADPWRVPLVPLGQGALNATAFLSGGRLHLGVEVALRPTGLNPAARVEAQASIIAIPLSGIGDAQVLPRAIAILRAPGGGGALATTGQMAVSALRAGLAWDGTALAPLLELVDVDLGGSQHDRIDLATASWPPRAARSRWPWRLRSARQGLAASWRHWPGWWRRPAIRRGPSPSIPCSWCRTPRGPSRPCTGLRC
jgi:hypothetical protein